MPTVRIIDQPGAGRGLVTAIPLREGDVVARIRGHRFRDRPTRTSLQVAAGRHLDIPGTLAYLNHSCDPSTYVDVGTLEVVATRDLAAGEALTFFYPATEWEMASPFTCACASRHCLGRIRGARVVPTAMLARYRLSPHIQALAAARDAAVSS
ncbi:SET domain-containing protein-lysine N-methyltransferase [Streptomyces sp. NPDC001667]